MSRQPSTTRVEKGFTIIETMIVLAMAGLILLIVLYAIPTLQRNSRNNQRKQDIQDILQAVSNYELNNSGNMPSSGAPIALPQLTFYTDPVPLGPTITYFAMPNPCVPPNNVAAVNFCIAGNWTDAPSGAVNNSVNRLDSVLIYNHEKCDPANAGHSTRTGAGFSDVVALYAIETGNGGDAPVCQQL